MQESDLFYIFYIFAPLRQATQNNVSGLSVCRRIVGLGGLEVTCSPRDPRFAGSNPAEVGGFFQDVKILSTSPPRGTLS